MFEIFWISEDHVWNGRFWEKDRGVERTEFGLWLPPANWNENMYILVLEMLCYVSCVDLLSYANIHPLHFFLSLVTHFEGAISLFVFLLIYTKHDVKCLRFWNQWCSDSMGAGTSPLRYNREVVEIKSLSQNIMDRHDDRPQSFKNFWKIPRGLKRVEQERRPTPDRDKIF